MFWMLFSGTRASVIQFTPALFSCETVCAYLYSHAVTETVNNVSQYNTGWTDWKCVELDNRIFTSVLLCFILFTLVAHENFWKLKLGEVLVRVGQYPAGSFISSVTACWDLTGTLLVSWLEWWWYCTKTSCETWQQLCVTACWNLTVLHWAK